MLGLVPLVLAGCSELESKQEVQHDAQVRRALSEPLDPDIVQLVTFYSNNPFMSFDDAGDPNPEGLKVEALYAISGKTKKGAYGDGLTRFKMYVIHRSPKEQPWGELLKTWEFTPEQAVGWRVTRKVPHLGWPYQFHLNWGEADVAGQEIRIVPEFVRRDGQIVRGTAKDLRVPPRQFDVRYSDQVKLPQDAPPDGAPAKPQPAATEPFGPPVPSSR